MDLDAEREKITKEIKELERILDPNFSSISVELSESSLDSDSDADVLLDEDYNTAGPPVLEEERWEEASNDDDDAKEKALSEDPETCLQLNMVYQEVIQEKLAEVSLLLAQNREQQEEIMWDLAGSKGSKVKDGKSLPPNMYVGHFMKPYFKDKVTGVGPPANEDTREKAAQGIKAFEELLVTKWKNWEKALLRKSVVSDRLQRLLQPKLLKLEYLRQKQSRVTSEVEKQILEKQTGETEKEVQDINELSEEALLGSRLDNHDWEKISNINFEGDRSAKELQKFWQNYEHPSINKEEWSRQEVDQLKAIAAKHGHLEWQKIAEELGTSRSAFQCLQKYQQHNKALKRKEWTEEEDRILTQLVQEMRVGDHIPYRKIAYYMEGRDSVQLIYRWTKSLDPNLKKGYWAPEEDAKLLKAVAKYGEQDWFKIREEVPGRSDAQCRDRYLRRLHFSLKKGRWNSKEEEKLIELIEKYGVGHWTKIASELPHRTGSQCLSKWKIMLRQRQSRGRRRQRRPLRRLQWSSSSEDSSSSGRSEDSESEEAPETQEDVRALPSIQHTVPDMNLPPKDSSAAQNSIRKAGITALAPTEEMGQAQAPFSTHSARPSGVSAPHSTDTQPVTSERPAEERERQLVKVPQKAVLQVLKTNTAAQRRAQKLKRPHSPCSAMEACPAGSSTARLHGQQRRGHSLQRRLLGRQLLMAVSPWIGDVVLPCSAQRPASTHTRADEIRKQLQDARLTSTPVFTLFIQLFQIDTAGCMEVVRERKAPPPPPPPPPSKVPSSAQDTPDCLFLNVSSHQAAEKSTHPKGTGGGLKACQAMPTTQAPRPKTVSELLREKRLREARAKKATQNPIVLPSSLLVSSPVILQPSHPLAPQVPLGTVLSGLRAPASTSVSTSDPSDSVDKRPPALKALAIAPSPTGTVKAPVSSLGGVAPTASRAPAQGPNWVPVNCRLGNLGQSQAPATCRKQGLPEVPLFLPAAPSPAQPPVQPVTLMPFLDTQKAVPHTVASTSVPVTWVLTTQGLLPVPAMVSLTEPAGTSDPQGLLVTLPPSLNKTQADQGPQLTGLSHSDQPPANTDVELNLISRTGHSALPAFLSAQSSAEVDTDTAQAPTGKTTAPKTSPQVVLLADHPEAESSYSNQLPPHGVSDPGVSSSEPRGPLGPERPPLPQPGPGKGALDLGLLSQESETTIREWLRGQRGVYVPPLGTRLPYQPPTLCSLRALSGLLLHKRALEHRATSLVPSGTVPALQMVLEQVRRQVQDSPAYLLLKARFLAAFTLPALLATLPPHGVPTTLSAAAGTDSGSEDYEDLEELDPSAGVTQRGPAEIVVDADETSAPSWNSSDDLDAPRTRLALKRRRLL